MSRQQQTVELGDEARKDPLMPVTGTRPSSGPAQAFNEPTDVPAGIQPGAGSALDDPVVAAGELRLPLKALMLFTRQMAMLLTSGSALVPALASIARQMPRESHARLVRELQREIERGTALTDALAQFPSTFDPVYTALVAAGEASATLPDTFRRLADMIAKRRSIQNKVLGAMAYPSLLIILCSGIISILLFFVIPRFAGLFETLRLPLPTTTQWLITIADFLRTQWYVPIVAITVGITAIVLVFKTAGGRQWLADVQLKIPLIGSLTCRLIQARLFRIVGLLIQTHVGVLESLDLARRVTLNRRFQGMFDAMIESVTSGRSMSGAMEESGLVSSPICQAIATGESSGNLGGAVSFAADVLDNENEEIISALTKLVEPMILIIMGMLIGTVAVSLFLPLFDITSAVR
jgi:type II secretory pathway component PulF